MIYKHVITYCVTWGASLFQWEYLWSPRMGHVSPNAIWTLIWCFTPINMTNNATELFKKNIYFISFLKWSQKGLNSYQYTAEVQQDCTHCCCPKLCTWWLQDVPADGHGFWSTRHLCHSFWKEDLEPSEIKICEGYKRTNRFGQSYCYTMVN